jgi:Trypsin-like peptidase domain
MSGSPTVTQLLELCTARLDTTGGPVGTAFFVAPRYAVTCSHVVGGTVGLPVYLEGRAGKWKGRVTDALPAHGTAQQSAGERYEAPDVALIHVETGATPTCALLARRPADLCVPVVARGYTATYDENSITAESGVFTVDGYLETPDRSCTLIKLAQGQAVPGMSGAPVLNLHTGEVIGILRTSRDVHSDLGGWVVPADLIRQLWTAEVGAGQDRFHEKDARWQLAGIALRRDRRRASPAQPPAAGSTSIGTVTGGTVITGGTFHGLTISPRPGSATGQADG